jgi:hypothetical protein
MFPTHFAFCERGTSEQESKAKYSHLSAWSEGELPRKVRSSPQQVETPSEQAKESQTDKKDGSQPAFLTD